MNQNYFKCSHSLSNFSSFLRIYMKKIILNMGKASYPIYVNCSIHSSSLIVKASKQLKIPNNRDNIKLLHNQDHVLEIIFTQTIINNPIKYLEYVFKWRIHINIKCTYNISVKFKIVCLISLIYVILKVQEELYQMLIMVIFVYLYVLSKVFNKYLITFKMKKKKTLTKNPIHSSKPTSHAISSIPHEFTQNCFSNFKALEML